MSNNKILSFYHLIFIVSLSLGCEFSDSESDSLLTSYKINSSDNETVFLPNDLSEVSGLAYLDDNHLLTHNDEEGIVYKINTSTAEVISEYSIGKKEIEKDFEGIAVVKDSVYLVTSNGTLIKFSLSNVNNLIEYEKIKTPLTSKNNVEGLCYEEDTNSLLLACKDSPGKGYKNHKAIYQYKLDDMNFIEKPRFLISLKELKKDFDIKDFSPSGIEVNPINSNYFIISANPEVIVELNPDGKLVNAKKINDKKHKQPEGITFLKDATLILADESNGKKARLTLIQLHK
jgi:uncharacterized protein YjiK